MPKNIVVFSDGTGQEGGEGHNTNIYKMFNMVLDRSPSQIAFYDAGLGTGSQKITGSVGGMGITRNIKQCYRFIFENYEAGDKVYLFGFSRGAATIRSLSSFIHYFGVLPKSRPELIDKAYKIYKIRNKKKREKAADTFVRGNRTIWINIHFLGCYDSVAALGMPNTLASAVLDGLPGFRHKFHDFTLSDSVRHAYQALAIDDERFTFHPILWDVPANPNQSIRQVWFAGMHTDVGGGYREQSISDIPLVWMTDMAVKQGLLIYPRHKVEINENHNGHMHDSRGTKIEKIYRRKQRFWPAGRKDKPVIHESVLQREKNRQNEDSPAYSPWIEKLAHDAEPWIAYERQGWYSDKNDIVDG